MLALMLLLETGTGGDAGVEQLRGVVASATGRCPRGHSGEVVVCGREPQERSPYRLPVIAGEDGFQVDGPVDSVSRERHRLVDVGGAGAQQNACTSTGAAGWTGCMGKQWKEADEQRGFRPH